MRYRLVENVNLDMLFVHVLKLDDPRANQADLLAAKRKKVEGLKAQQIWTVFRTENLSTDVNVVGGTFVHTLKIYLALEEPGKISCDIQGFDDLLIDLVAHDVTSLRQPSIRLILSIAYVYNMLIFSHDVTQSVPIIIIKRQNVSRKLPLPKKVESKSVWDETWGDSST